LHQRTLELKVPPVLLVALLAGAGYGLAHALPGLAFDFTGRRMLALVLALAGSAIVLAGVAAFARHRTTVNPHRPENSSAVVSSGIYRFTRNPMYLGMLLGLVGWTLFLANAAGALALPLFVLWMNRFQIGPEERILSARFGAAYANYRAKVRRWL